MWTGTGIAAVFLIVGIAWLILSMIGEKNMLAAEKKAEQDVNETDTEPRAAVSQDTLRYTELTSLDDFGKEKWNEGILKYKDKYYRYNERLQNYLFMGIDAGVFAQCRVETLQLDKRILLQADNLVA